MKELLVKCLDLTFSYTHNLSSYGIFTSIFLALFKYGPSILEKWFNTSFKFIDLLERIEEYKKKAKENAKDQT